MVATKKASLFYLFLLLISLLAGLLLILPQFSQESLRERLISGFSQALHQPCRIDKVTLQALPRPALVLHDFTSSQAESTFDARKLILDLSLRSLLSFSPEVVGVRLQGALIKSPLTLLSSAGDELSALTAPATFPVSISAINRSLWSRKLHLEYFLIKDSVCDLSGIYGLRNPLSVTDLNGSWRFSQRNLSEKLELAGSCGGGRGDLKMTWYRVAGGNADGREKLFDRAGDRIELSCNLKDISLVDYEFMLSADGHRSWRGGFTRGRLRLDVNGNPEGGLRVAAHFSCADHTLTSYDAVSDTEKICSRGELKASLNGFFKRHDGYLNIKSAALEYPGAATLFYRGLVRFNDPLFVDLVSELKVDDVGLLTRRLPFLTLSGYQAEGQLAGQLKLVGNPHSAPVLQVKLKAKKIVLQPNNELSTAAGVEKKTENRRLSEFKLRFGEWLRQVAKWGWLIKSDCKIATLELPEMTISDISLLAEKSLVQVEIERLAANFGKSGQLRLSLILENLLHDPHWQASLIAEKLDLKPFRKTMPWVGILDGSLVGGGLIRSESGEVSDLDLNGKWILRYGSLSGCPLLKKFSNFLERAGKKRMGLSFSSFAGKFSLRDDVLRLENLKLVAGDGLINAGGRFFVADNRLQLSGRYQAKTSSPLSFKLSGNCQKPEFKISGR